ncbi:MAG: peptidase [Rhizobacter sp.]|nr:peptidase [Rhizobacter sp.]
MTHYRIDVAGDFKHHGDRYLGSAPAHQFHVTVLIADPAAKQRFSLPVWIPGSYLVREFARHLSAMTATQGDKAVPLLQLDKATWEADCAAGQPLTLAYDVYAFDTSVRAAFLDSNRGFFNGTGVFVRVHGAEELQQQMQIGTLPHGWKAATAMTPLVVDESGIGTYKAAHYDELVDHPVELGRFWRGEFTAAGVAHEFVVAGALPSFDGERLLADAQRICEAEIAFWHADGSAPPFKRYVFMLNAVDDGYGGLEHRASTALICGRRDLPRLAAPQQAKAAAEPVRSDGYVTLLGLISHEYFHSWNVKQLRPAEFERYDYTRENYTELLWFFEGFTSYYDDLFLVRAGLIDKPRYLKLLAKTVTGVLGAPGRKVQSVAQSSFDAWVKYYRQDENTPNATISYYTKGSLVALALDLTLRTTGSGSLDAVMRRLWSDSRGGPISEADVAKALEAVAGRSLADELMAWVHGTGDLPLRRLLDAVAVDWKFEAASVAQRLGVRVAESPLTGVQVKAVLRGGAGELAGLAPGDELLALNGWRLRRLDDALLVLEPEAAALADQEPPLVVNDLLIARDQRVHTLPLVLEDSPEAGAVALTLADVPLRDAAALREAWLAG